jgi:hypothetical protein
MPRILRQRTYQTGDCEPKKKGERHSFELYLGGVERLLSHPMKPVSGLWATNGRRPVLTILPFRVHGVQVHVDDRLGPVVAQSRKPRTQLAHEHDPEN